jgi:hypothetical protein
VEVLRDAFRAIHGLVAALSARCELLEPEARADALQRVAKVSDAVEKLGQSAGAKPADEA